MGLAKVINKPSLARRVYLIVLVSVACCALFIGAFSYRQDKNVLSKNTGSGLEKIAQTAAISINGTTLAGIKSPQDFAYLKINRYLSSVREHNNIASPIYILRKTGRNTASLLVTTEEGSPFGAEFKLNPTMKRVLSSGRSGFSPIYSDKSGTWISAYAPIKNDNGFIAGILEIDYHVGYYLRQLRYRLLKIMMFCGLGFLIGAFLGIPLLRPILESINALNTAASEMEKGNYDYKVESKSSDEIGHLAHAFEKMRIAIKDYIEQLKVAWLKEKSAHLESVKALSEAIAVRETYTKGHIERVSKYAELICRELGLSEQEIEVIKQGCIIHDIGKIGIDMNLINKPSKLTTEERERIKKHPVLGAKIVEGVEYLEKARDIILYHHERYDGKGYPKGLKGEEIPISVRIVTLVDAYDAMASSRPYRKKFKSDEIEARIKADSGKQFDPKVVKAFLRVKDKLAG